MPCSVGFGAMRGVVERLEEYNATFGIIAIDGNEATLGTAQFLGSNPSVTKVVHLSSNTASRTRRGGQSALRYSRLRDESELAFLRKVAEHIGAVSPRVSGLVLAGKAEMKRKLLVDLPEALRSRVLCCVNLSVNADTAGLREAARLAGPAIASTERREVEEIVGHFLESLVIEGGSMCCYGARQTLQALKMGAVDHLLLATRSEGRCGHDLQEFMRLCGLHNAKLTRVAANTEQCAYFCKSFVVAGCLRWPVDPGLLDEEDNENEEAAKPAVREDATEDSSPEGTATDSDASATETESLHSGSASSLGEMLDWLRGTLQPLVHEASVDALTVCIEVILADQTTPAWDAAIAVAEVLATEGLPEVGEELASRWLSSCEEFRE